MEVESNEGGNIETPKSVVAVLWRPELTIGDAITETVSLISLKM